jgi:translation initiation factor 1
VSRKKPSSPDVPERLSTPFAALGSLRETLPAGPAGRGNAPAKTPRVPPRAVVRYERKGRGGKEATVIEQLDLSAAERSAWLQALKQSLGCGGTLEGEALVLQGDQRPRVRDWLSARGVPRISMG